MLKKPSVLIVLSFLLWSSFSFAETKTRVKWGGDYRLRAYIVDNLTFGSSEKQDDYTHRLLLKGEMAPNDDIEIHFSVNLNQALGGEGRRGFGGLENFNDNSENIRVLTAYVDWHLGSSFFLKLGRMDFNWGNEIIISNNRDDQQPYSFGGMVLGYESESFLFNTGTLKVGDWDRSLSLATASTIDPDELAYFVLLDFKSFGKVLEIAEFFILRLQSSDFEDTAKSISVAGSSLNRLGLSLGSAKGRLLYQLDYVNLQGSYNSGVSAQAWMGHLNLGVNFGEKHQGSVYIIGHYDTGDDSASSETDEGYRPIYYNHHKYAGLMDILAWGNLTYYGLGATFIRKGRTEFKAQALRFLLTDSLKGPKSISYLGYGDTSSFISENVSKNTNNITSSDLGTEFDFVVKRKFTSGAYVELILGAFLPDTYFEAYGRDDTIYSFRLSTGFSF